MANASVISNSTCSPSLTCCSIAGSFTLTLTRLLLGPSTVMVPTAPDGRWPGCARDKLGHHYAARRGDLLDTSRHDARALATLGSRRSTAATPSRCRFRPRTSPSAMHREPPGAEALSHWCGRGTGPRPDPLPWAGPGGDHALLSARALPPRTLFALAELHATRHQASVGKISSSRSRPFFR